MATATGTRNSQPNTAGQLAAGNDTPNRRRTTPTNASLGSRMTCGDGSGVWDDESGGSDCCEDDTPSSSHCNCAISHNGIAS